MCQVGSWSGYGQNTLCTRMKFSKNKYKCAFKITKENTALF